MLNKQNNNSRKVTDIIKYALRPYCIYSMASRLTVVSRKAKKKQHTRVTSGPCALYSELFTPMAALKFESAVTKPL